MGGKGDHACSAEADIEQAAGEHRPKLLHHRDLVANAWLKSEQIISVHDNLLVLELNNDDLLTGIGKIDLPLPLRLGQGSAFTTDGLLEKVADSLVEHSFTREFHVAPVGDHGTHLRPYFTVQVQFEKARSFELEDPFASIALRGSLDEFLKRVAIDPGGGLW